MASSFPFKENEFWNKKFRHHLKYRDVNSDGFIERDDFFIVVDRYQKMGASEEAVKKLRESGENLCDALGLVGGKTLSYDDFTKKSIDIFENQGYGLVHASLSIMFDIIDTNGDGEISFDEWDTYCNAMGIPNAKASFESMDTDQNRKVSREEFEAYNKEFFFSSEDNLHSSILFGPIE